MENLEYSLLITYLVKKGKTATEINMEPVNVYGDPAPSYTTVRLWTVKFRQGWEDIKMVN
jgi:hypothetical protein